VKTIYSANRFFAAINFLWRRGKHKAMLGIIKHINYSQQFIDFLIKIHEKMLSFLSV